MAFNYIISYGPGITGPWTQYGSTLTTTSVSLTGLASGDTFYVQVVAVDSITTLPSAPVVSGPYKTLALTTESADGTFITTTAQSILASPTRGQAAAPGTTLVTWTFDANGQIFQNGTAAGFTAAILGIWYSGHIIYQKASNANALGVNPGWWSWNGSAWVDEQNPIPTTSKILIDLILPQNTNVPFSVGGTIAGYAAAPTLQYSNNQTGSWVNLPTGASSVVVSTQGNDRYGTFTFTHPAVAVGALNQTVSVRDAAATTVSNTSAPFNITTPGTITITGITLSNSNFIANSPTGTAVGAISVQTTGTFNGTLGLSGTDAGSFQISGNTLQTKGILTARTYSINLVATQVGAVGSPFTAPQSIVGITSTVILFNPGSPFPSVNNTGGNSITTNFASTTTGICNKAAFGVASGGATARQGVPYDLSLYADTTFINAFAPLDFRLVRVAHISAMGDIFFNGRGGGDTLDGQLETISTMTTPNWSFVDPLMNNFKRAFPNAKLILNLANNNRFNFADAGTRAAVVEGYRLTCQHFKNGGLPVDYWEIVNEPDAPQTGIPSNVNVLCEQAARTAIHSVDANALVGGPTSTADNTYVADSINGGAQFIDFHNYSFNPGTNPSDLQVYSAAFYGATHASSSLLSFMTEYNLDTFNNGNSDARMATYKGAVYDAIRTISNTYSGFSGNTIWRIDQPDGNYPIYLGGGSVSPGGRFLAAATKYMGGQILTTQVNANFGTNNANGSILAMTTLDTTTWGMIIINYNTVASWTGSVTISGFPGSTLTRWDMDSTRTQGVTNTINTSSLTSVTVPSAGITILSGAR